MAALLPLEIRGDGEGGGGGARLLVFFLMHETLSPVVAFLARCDPSGLAGRLARNLHRPRGPWPFGRVRMRRALVGGQRTQGDLTKIRRGGRSKYGGGHGGNECNNSIQRFENTAYHELPISRC